MAGTDELSAEELSYLDSGGKSELPATPAVTEQPATEQQKPAEQTAAGEPKPAETEPDDEGLEVVEVRDGRARGKDGKFVSHKALHSEREKHKLTKAENQKLREQLARGQERLEVLNQAFNGQQPPAAQQQHTEKSPLEEETIDPEKDLFGAFKQQQRRNEFLARQIHDGQQKQTTRDQISTVQSIYSNDARSFMAREPQFADAYKHLVNGRDKELEALGVSDPVKRKEMVENEERQLVLTAIQNKQSPAEVIFKMAKSRGFTPKAQGTATTTNEQQPNAAVEKIRQLQNGQNASATLSNVGGGPNPGLTFETLANMSDAEFAAAVDGMSKQQVERLLGGRA